MYKLLIVLSLLLSKSLLYAQRCGQAVYTVKFESPTGEPLENIRYKLFAVTPAVTDRLLAAIYGPEENEQRIRIDTYEGVLIDDSAINMRGILGSHQTVMKWNDFNDSVWTKRLRGIVSDPTQIERLRAWDSLFIYTLQRTAKAKGLGEIKFQGSVKNGLLQFPTSEGYDRLFLLKFTSGNESGYLLGELFGGCNRTMNIRWDKIGGFRKLQVTDN